MILDYILNTLYGKCIVLYYALQYQTNAISYIGLKVNDVQVLLKNPGKKTVDALILSLLRLRLVVLLRYIVLQ